MEEQEGWKKHRVYGRVPLGETPKQKPYYQSSNSIADSKLECYSKAHNYLHIDSGRGYKPRQRRCEGSLNECQLIFSLYYNT